MFFTTVVIFTFLGLIIGSFAGVVLVRTAQKEGYYFDRSRCDHCRKEIFWYDNIPLVSYLVLGGKCRYCKEKISIVHLVVEVVNGVIWGGCGVYAAFFSTPVGWMTALFWAILSTVTLVVILYDWWHMEIPMVAVWWGIGIAALYTLLSWLLFSSVENWRFFVAPLLGALFFVVIFGALVWFSAERWMGMGDVYVGALVGLVVGWPAAFVAMTFAFIIGAFWGVGLMVKQRSFVLNKAVPFAPFLFFSMWVVLLVNTFSPQFLWWVEILKVNI